MSYRNEQLALAQRVSDLTARLAAAQRARAALAGSLQEEEDLCRELAAVRKQLAPSAAEVRRRLPTLQSVEVAALCDAEWDAMEGDKKKRFCAPCQRFVHNLAELTTAEAEALLLEPDRVCVRLYRRADGTILTQDCPVGLRRRKRRRLAAAASALALGALGAMLTKVSPKPPTSNLASTPIPSQPVQTQLERPERAAPRAAELARRFSEPPAEVGDGTLGIGVIGVLRAAPGNLERPSRTPPRSGR